MNAWIIATTRVEDDPRPEPTGASQKVRQLERDGAAAVVVRNHVLVHGRVQRQLPVERANLVQVCHRLTLLVGRQ